MGCVVASRYRVCYECYDVHDVTSCYAVLYDVDLRIVGLGDRVTPGGGGGRARDRLDKRRGGRDDNAGRHRQQGTYRNRR